MGWWMQKIARPFGGRLFATLLLATFVVSFGAVLLWLRQPADAALIEIRPLQVGERFRSPLYAVADGDVVPRTGACVVIIVVDPVCASCAQLAETVRNHRDHRMMRQFRWVSVGTSERTRAFGERHGLSPSQLFLIDPSLARGSSERLAALGIPMVPIAVVLDRESRVIARRVAMDPSDLDSLHAEACG